MRFRFSFVFAVILLATAFLTAFRTMPVTAFNPPVDSAGALTVRIEAPETVTDPAEPTPVRVVIENHGGVKLDGSLQLQLIDGWNAAPAPSQRFSVAAKETWTQDYSLVAPPTVYNARYPIHAIAEWNEPNPTNHASPETPYTAHPIAIFHVRSPNPPRPATPPIAWEPFRLAPETRIALDELPAVRVGFGKFADRQNDDGANSGRNGNKGNVADSVTMEPVGWFGEGAEHRGFVRRETTALNGGSFAGFASHVPWTGGAGFSIVEIPLTLPDSTPYSESTWLYNDSIYLGFNTGIQREHRGDGMTFNVRVLPWDAPDNALGEVIWTRHQTTPGSWESGAVSLNSYLGSSIRLQFEWNSGPYHDTSFDLGYWGDLVLEHDDGTDAGRNQPVEPLSLGGTTIIHPGVRGLLDADFDFPTIPDSDVGIPGFHGIPVKVLGSRLDSRTSAIRLRKVVMEKGNFGEQDDQIVFRHSFESPTDGTFDVVVTLTAIPASALAPKNITDVICPGTVQIDVALENAPAPQPWRTIRLEDVAIGSWKEGVTTFYGGVGNVVKNPGPMRLGFDGHQLASSYVGLEFDAMDRKNVALPCVVLGTTNTPDYFELSPKTNDPTNQLSQHASLHTASIDRVTFFVIPCHDVWDGVSRWRDVCGKGKSPDADQLAGRFVFDLWGGRYVETTENLRLAFQYGLTDSVVVFHNWQRWGYDYRLPEIWPPNPEYGTESKMRALADLCREHDVVFAPHDNYVDIYPDAEGFSYHDSVAFTESGTPHEAWLNEGRGAQSYRYRADAIDRLMRPNIEKIQSGIAPTGYFIDVWSSLGAYDYWTSTGEFVDRSYTNRVWGETFNHIRETFRENARANGVLHGAPQISESGHDGLIGILDGAQANHLRVEHPEKARGWSIWNIPHDDAERTPWLDAAYHDRFILHGAGYPGRYEGGLSPAEHGIYTDDYICTEVLCGHPSMVPAAFGRDVVRKYWLTAPLARRLAGATITSIEYVDGNIHHQCVTWTTSGKDPQNQGPITVWVNRGEADWDIGTFPNAHHFVLPPYGFVAKEAKLGFFAGITRMKETGLIEEGSEEYWPDGRTVSYVNARYPIGHQTLRCEVESLVFEGANPRRFSGILAWETDSPIPGDYRLFLHVTDTDSVAEGIMYQPAVEQPHRTQMNVSEQDGSSTKKFTTTFSGELPATVVERIAAGGTIELRGGLYRPSDGRRLEMTGTRDDGRRRRWIVFGKNDSDDAKLMVSPVAAEPDRTMERLNPKKIMVNRREVETAYGYRIERKPGIGSGSATITPLPAPPGFNGITFEAKMECEKGWTFTAVGHDGQEVKTDSSISDDGRTMNLIATPDVFQFKINCVNE